MGAALSYVAIRDKPDSGLLKSLHIIEMPSDTDLHALYGADTINGCVFESGWFVITNYGDPQDLLSPKILKQLSAESRLVACEVEEHVMCSTAAGWINGEQVWSVVYDSQEADEEIVVTGKPPVGFSEMSAALRKELTFFEIPTELVHNICGFEYLGNNLFPHFEIDF